MKRIAIMVNSLSFGGAERIMSELSVYLHSRGYEVHFLLMDDSEIAYEYAGEIHEISKYYQKSSIICTLLTFQHFLLTFYYKRKLKIDYTISAMEFLNFVNLLTPCGDKMVMTLHNYRLQCEVTPTLKDKFIEYVFSRRINKNHTIVTVSKAICDKVKKLYKLPDENFITIYNAFEVCKIIKLAEEPINERISSFMTSHTFVNMARYVDQKSLDKLIEAFAIVAVKYPEARLILAGNGDKRKELEALAAALSVSDRVLFTGFLKNPFPLVKKSLAFVLSSHYEGFGNVIVEALACGKTVISTDCLCGPREILAPETKNADIDVELCEFGILTKNHNGVKGVGVNELARAMEMVMENPEIVKGYEEKAQKRAYDFIPEKMYSRWDSILR